METTKNKSEQGTEKLGDILDRMSNRFFSDTTEQSHTATKDAQGDRPGGSSNLEVASETSPLTDYARVEVSLESIGYFQAGYKRTYPKPQEKRVIKLASDRIIEFYPNATLGYPNTDDKDFFRGLNKIVANRATMKKRWNTKTEVWDLHPQIKSPISFTTAELLRASGKTKSEQNVRALKNFIKRQIAHLMTGTFWSAKSQQLEQFSGSLFQQAHLRGEKTKKGVTAETHLVWLSPLFLSNFYYHYYKPIDLAYYRSLRKPIAKGLHSLLDVGWYAVINNGGFYWEKSYQDLCHLLQITPYKHLSDIKRQLDPSHKELNDYKKNRDEYRLLERWEYRKSAKNDGDYIVRYYPSTKFFMDQRFRMERIEKTELINSPQKQPALNEEQKLLLAEIMSFCGDTENEPAYYQAIRNHPRNLLWRVLAETRLASREKRITKSKGAYFMDTIKRFHP